MIFRASREHYTEEAIGYVQVKRMGSLCTVKAKVTPEHRVRSKCYNVTSLIDEAEEEIKHAVCSDCAASLGMFFL